MLIALLAGLLSAPATAQKPERPSNQDGTRQAPAAKEDGPPRVAAKAWILIDPRDGSILASKAPEKRLPIASATKLMTAYLALENLKPGQIVRAAAYQPSAAAEITLGLRRASGSKPAICSTACCCRAPTTRPRRSRSRSRAPFPPS